MFSCYPTSHIPAFKAAIPTNLFIIDAIDTLTKAQECRHGGCPAKLGTMISGTDPVSLDNYGKQLLQKVDPYLPKNIKYIEYAQQYGIGTKNYTTTKI